MSSMTRRAERASRVIVRDLPPYFLCRQKSKFSDLFPWHSFVQVECASLTSYLFNDTTFDVSASSSERSQVSERRDLVKRS